MPIWHRCQGFVDQGSGGGSGPCTSRSEGSITQSASNESPDPRERECTQLAAEGRQVVGSPLLADLPLIGDPVDVNGIAGHGASGRWNPQQVAFLSRSDDKSHNYQIVASDHVLLGSDEIRKCSEEKGEQASE